MKFTVVLCLFALAVAEEEAQDQNQQTESTGGTKQTLTPTQATQGFPAQAFPSVPLNFGAKDVGNVGNVGNVANVPFTGFVGGFPVASSLPVQPVSPDFFANGQGVPNAGVPTFAHLPRTAYQGPSPGLANNLPSNFHVPTVQVPVSNLGNHFPGLSGAHVYPSFQNGGQGVPAGGFAGNGGNVGFTGLTGTPGFQGYRVLPQEALQGFAQQGLQHQTVLPTNGGLANFPAGILTNGVFTGNQGVLKTPLTGNGHAHLNVPTLTTGNVQTDPSGTVFRRV